MNDYSKRLILQVGVDKSKMQQIEKDFDNLTLSHIVSPEAYKEFKQQYSDIQARMEKIQLLKTSIEEIQMFGGDDAAIALKDMTTELSKLQNMADETAKTSIGKSKLETGPSAGDYLKGTFSKIADAGVDMFKKAASAIKDVFVDAIQNAMSAINEMASFDLANSLTINSDAREQAMQYGLSNSENYAFSQVKNEMGIQSEEDMFYMNEAQRERFAERMGYYSSKYDKLENEGFFKTWQEFQISWTEFKTDFAMEIAEFFVNNKDTIMAVLKMLMSFMEAMLSLVSWIVNALGINERTDSQRAAATTDIINNYKSSNSSNTSVKIDNTFNGVDKQDRSWLQNAGNMTYEQVIKALA